MKSCVYCGTKLTRSSTTRDHVPPKSLLGKKDGSNTTVDCCKSCNSGYSSDEEYFAAFLALILCDPDRPFSTQLELILESNWKLQDHFNQLLEVETGGRVSITPDHMRIDRVVLKMALGHIAASKALLEPLKTAKIHSALIADLPQASLTSFSESEVGWVGVETGVYRYRILQSKNLSVQSVIQERFITEVSWT